MTREEAIELLDNLIGMVEDNHNSDYDTAFKMAIKALVEQEPCGDTISRQAVHIELEKWITYGEYKYSNATKYLYDRIDRLPPVNLQEPKAGYPQKSCDTCEYSDEVDGSNCYECVKDMRNNYSPKKIEPSGETVSLEAFKQVMWERDIAIVQLHELGYGFGQKIEPKTGHWMIVYRKSIYAHLVCDKCLSNAPYDCRTNYCPNCGAKMVEPQESKEEDE